MSETALSILIWLVLLLLLALNVGQSFVFTGASGIAASLGLAFAMATLVFWFNMQLREEKGILRVFAMGAGAWLMILFLLAAADYVTRGAY